MRYLHRQAKKRKDTRLIDREAHDEPLLFSITTTHLTYEQTRRAAQGGSVC